MEDGRLSIDNQLSGDEEIKFKDPQKLLDQLQTKLGSTTPMNDSISLTCFNKSNVTAPIAISDFVDQATPAIEDRDCQRDPQDQVVSQPPMALSDSAEDTFITADAQPYIPSCNSRL